MRGPPADESGPQRFSHEAVWKEVCWHCSMHVSPSASRAGRCSSLRPRAMSNTVFPLSQIASSDNTSRTVRGSMYS